MKVLLISQSIELPLERRDYACLICAASNSTTASCKGLPFAFLWFDMDFGELSTDYCFIANISRKLASWSYSCDSKVSFDRVQILTPDFSGRRHPPPSPPSLSPPPLSSSLSSSHLPSLPPSLLPLRRKFDSVLSSLFGMRLALRILRPHSLTLTVSLSHCLTVSLSHCLTVSLISLISLISFSSLSSLSPLSLSLLSVSRLSVSLLSLLSQEDPGKEPHIKDSSPLPPKRALCFFLPRCPPLSHSGALAFAPPLASSGRQSFAG